MHYCLDGGVHCNHQGKMLRRILRIFFEKSYQQKQLLLLLSSGASMPMSMLSILIFLQMIKKQNHSYLKELCWKLKINTKVV